jgi:hypothetical protein
MHRLSSLAFVLVATSALAQAPEAPAAPALAAPAPGAPAADKSPLDEANDILAHQHDAKSFERAVAVFDAELAKKPGDLDLQLKLATALNAVMRAKTQGNLALVDGTSDTPANKKVWAELGKRANDLMTTVQKARPKDVEVALQAAESYMYLSSSMGIIQAVMSGAANQYKKNADAILALDKTADDDVGDVYHGAFYIVAPWPMSDVKKAREHFAKAAAIAPRSVRNRYYVGLAAFKDGDFATAEKEFTFARDNACTTKSEIDFCSAIKAQAKLGLEQIAKKK